MGSIPRTLVKMINTLRSARLLIVAGALVFFVGAWFIFWALSDSLLNMLRCGNEYSLLSPLAECRRPVIFEILGFVSIGGSLLLFVRAWRRFQPLPEQRQIDEP
jgi:hypothetical protein